jgi:hypothetical protein
MSPRWIIGVPLLVGLLSGGSARAFTIFGALAPGCHENITSEALREARLRFPTAAPLSLTANEQALVDDLQFTPPDDMKDLGGATLLVSVRDNDLKGRSSDDLTELSAVHGDPKNQQEHCLRAGDEKEPGGSEAAVRDCRAFILGRVSEALDGLDALGKPDSNQRTSLTVHLALRGKMDAPLPTYYVRMGQALHALEDSFTHTYRTPDGMKITVVLNWLQFVDGTLVESRDGPPHTASLDVCNDPDDLRKARHQLAILASTALLQATLDPQKTRDQKMTAAASVLDTYLSYSPGCTFDNHWCSASESQYQGTKSGCSSAGGGLSISAFLLALGALLWRARRRNSFSAFACALATAGALTLLASAALAETTAAPAAAQESTPPPTTTPVPQPGPANPSQTAFGVYAGISGSVDKAAIAGGLGLRLRTGKQLTFGLDGEWNPWVALSGSPSIKNGVINVYGTGILRFPLAYENFNLRTTVNLGVSYLLINLYGASSGSVGLYAGVSPLGLEWKLSKVFYLIINPLNIALPVPQLRGVPLSYPQYRFSIGLEISAS